MKKIKKFLKITGLSIFGFFLLMFIIGTLFPIEKIYDEYIPTVQAEEYEDIGEYIPMVQAEEYEDNGEESFDDFDMARVSFSNNVFVNSYTVNELNNILIVDFQLTHLSFSMALTGVERAVGDMIENYNAHEFEEIRVRAHTYGYDSLGDKSSFLLTSFTVPHRLIDAIYRNGRLRVNFQDNLENLFIHQSAQ